MGMDTSESCPWTPAPPPPSHNPWQDNGIKIFAHDGYKLPDETEIGIEQEITRVLATNPTVPEDAPLPEVNESYRADYIRFLLAAVPGISLDNRHIVLDCANGAASSVAPQLFESLQG